MLPRSPTCSRSQARCSLSSARPPALPLPRPSPHFIPRPGTLLSIFWLRLAILALLFILLQFAALTWYMLSYIPYGRALASRLVRRQLVRHGVLSPATAPIRPAVEPS